MYFVSDQVFFVWNGVFCFNSNIFCVESSLLCEINSFCSIESFVLNQIFLYMGFSELLGVVFTYLD